MEQAQIQIIGNNNDLKNDVEIILSDEKIGSTTVNKKINRKFFGKIIIKLRAATFFLPKRKDRIDRALKQQQQKQQSSTSTMSPGVVYDKKSAEDATIQNDDKIPSKSLPTTTTAATTTTTTTTTTAILTTTPKTTNKNVIDNDSTTMTVDTIQKSAKQHQEEVEKEKEEIVKAPISELMKPFLNLDTQETLTPSNVNASTCPNCHTPDSVYDVKDNDNAGLNSAKNGFICLSHTSYGCGWEGNHKPNEDDVAKNVFSTLGFKPLILN